jgi:hypothetical protein
MIPLLSWGGNERSITFRSHLRLMNLKGAIVFLAGALTDEKLAHFSRSIFNVAHHSLTLCLNFLPLRSNSIRNAVVGSWAQVWLVRSAIPWPSKRPANLVYFLLSTNKEVVVIN